MCARICTSHHNGMFQTLPNDDKLAWGGQQESMRVDQAVMLIRSMQSPLNLRPQVQRLDWLG